MSWIPAFTAWQFALAGALAATGPILIHLLNRRRYRTVQWAAMDFLREALQRNRRMLQIRDLLLMFLRALALLFFGLALARPFFSQHAASGDQRGPLHAIVVLDNSLSMGYESLQGTLLQRAQAVAKKFLEKLPSGSRATVIAAAGSSQSRSLDPFANLDSARDAIDAVELVDRGVLFSETFNQLLAAREKLPQMAKRVVIFTDQQALNWSGYTTSEALKNVPVQFVRLAPDDPENSWIASLRLEDGVADVETPAKIIVELGHAGARMRDDVQVALWVANEQVATKTISLEPGTSGRQVAFEHRFEGLQPESGRPLFVPIKATLTPDRLPADDERYLSAPVVASLPVVMIDSYGNGKEDPLKNRLGETRPLRRLLAPRFAGSDAQPLVKIRHLLPEQLSRDTLADARLVVIAGVDEPWAEHVSLLREYVKQGGQLLIAAGGSFDAKAWNEAAWLEGRGILPLPLQPELLGALPEKAAANWQPFFLNFESLAQNHLFRLNGVAEEDLRDLYSEPFFFQAVRVASDATIEQSLRDTLRNEILQSRTTPTSFNPQSPSANQVSAISTEREASSTWLTWANSAEMGPVSDVATDETQAANAALADKLVATRIERELPTVLARFSGQSPAPFLVQRRLGQGQILFCSSGLLPVWNTLASTSAVVIYDRLLREMLATTLPLRNYEPREQLALPVPAWENDLTLTLERPREQRQPLDATFLGSEQRGVVLTGLWQRGIYTAAARRSSGGDTENEKTWWEIPIAVNGGAEESDLASITADRFAELTANSGAVWLEEGEEISLAGAALRGQFLWWFLLLVVFVALLLEMSIVGWPARPASA